MLMPGTEILSFESGGTTGLLHVPAETAGKSLVLTHGAGSNAQAPLLVALAASFASAGWHVLRYDLPFRRQKRFGPPHPAHAGKDRDGLRAAVAALREAAPGRMFLGGHSYGGRQASMLASEDASVADGLLLLSYPLHPPNKPEQLRTAHFAALHTPAFFAHGSEDPFGTTEELRAALRLVAGATELVTIEGAGHDFKRGKFDLGSAIVAPFLDFSERFVERRGG